MNFSKTAASSQDKKNALFRHILTGTDLKSSIRTLNYDFLNMIERILMVKGIGDMRDYHFVNMLRRLFKTVLASIQRF